MKRAVLVVYMILVFVLANPAVANKPKGQTGSISAIERYTALQQANNGEILVYYDFLEDGKLTGGVDSLLLPDISPAMLRQEASVWPVTTLIDNGPVSNRIDVVFLGDGYTDPELGLYATEVDDLLPGWEGWPSGRSLRSCSRASATGSARCGRCTGPARWRSTSGRWASERLR